MKFKFFMKSYEKVDAFIKYFYLQKKKDSVQIWFSFYLFHDSNIKKGKQLE